MHKSNYPFLTFLKEIFLDWNNIFGAISNVILLISILIGLFTDAKTPSIIVAILALVFSCYRVWLVKHNQLLTLQESTVDIQITPKWVKNMMLLELFNNGPEDIQLKQLKIKWKQEEGPKERILTKYLPIDANIVLDSPTSEEFIASKQKLLATEIPNHTADNILNVEIVVKGLTSKKELRKKWMFEKFNNNWEDLKISWI